MFRHRRLIFILILLSAVPIVAMACYWGVKSHATGPHPSDQELRVTLVGPTVEPGAIPSGQPSHSVTFSYELANSGTKVLAALSFRLACSCQAVGKVPTTLGPGESTIVQFRFRVPDFGVSRFSIPILDGDQVIAVVEAALEADIVLPHLLIPPGPCAITAIRGAPSIGSVELVTLERREAPPWIEGLEIEPPGDLTATFDATHETPTDPGVARRNYIFRIHAAKTAEPAKDWQAAARVRFQPGSRAADAPLVRFPLTVTFKDPIVLLPNRVVFRRNDAFAEKPARVRIIRRDRRAFSPLTIVSAPDWVTARIESVPGGDAVVETLVVMPEQPQEGPLAGEVVLAVQSASGQEAALLIKLPVERLTERN